ncbi:MAG: ATP-binding protein [Lachnospiraceae bacterium]
MTIRQKIVLSNVMMVFIPICIAAFLVIAWVQTAGQKYWTPLEEMYEDRNAVVSAQNLIYAYQEELWDTNWKEVEAADEDQEYQDKSSDELEETAKMVEVKQELTKMGYHFSFEQDGETLYSNLTKTEEEQIERLMGEVLQKVDSISLGSGKISVIKSSFSEDDKTCSMIAINSGELAGEGTPSYLQKYVVPYIWAFVGALLVAIVIVNICCFRWITSLILPPLKRIREGAQRIRAGNLVEEIPVYRNDELGEACTEFNEMRKYLKESAEERVKYEIYRKELISGVSHDLGMPLTTIKGYVGGLLDGIADTQEKKEKYLRAIQVRAGDLENLINHLSVYNKMETQAFVYHMESVDLAAYMKKYITDNEAFCKHNQLHIALDIVGDSHWLQLDRQEFKRIIDNILMNSIRYRQKASSKCKITVENRGDSLLLEIADDGPGVPVEDLERIFVSFCRLDESRTRCSEGSGLGLAIVKRIVNDHKGSIYAKNQNGLVICMTFLEYAGGAQ